MKHLSFNLTERDLRGLFDKETLSPVARAVVSALIDSHFTVPRPALEEYIKALIVNGAKKQDGTNDTILAIKALRQACADSIEIREYFSRKGYEVRPLGLANAKWEVEMVLHGHSETIRNFALR